MMNDPVSSDPYGEIDMEKSVDFYIDHVCKYAPIIKKSLAEYGSLSIADYARNYSLPIEQGYQKKDDFFETVYNYLFPLHGDSIARRTVQDLTKTPWTLTANHHGVDFFAQSVQGSLLFSLILSSQNPDSSTIPILACGNVPLNNLTYPRGMLLYHCADNNIEALPQKIPVFSDKAKNGVVCATGPIDTSQISRVQKRVAKMKQQGLISPDFSDTINDLFEKEYGDPYVQEQKNYSDQSVILNQRIWKRMFSDAQTAKDIVYMELETIATRLLEIDLSDPESLISLLMFNTDARTHLMQELDGQHACWYENKLAKRLLEDVTDPFTRKQLGNCGTHFFWGVDHRNKLIPMYLYSPESSSIVLKGKDDRGKTYSLPFDPPSIVHALKHNHLLPSLFSCYTAISLARGITCIGGYYQSEYLPVMQNSVVTVLKKTARLESAAAKVEQINTTSYLSGMQTIMTGFNDNALIPAGPVEIIAGGGIRKKHIEQFNELTVKEAHLASLSETLPDVVPYDARTTGWQQDISQLCLELLREKISII